MSSDSSCDLSEEQSALNQPGWTMGRLLEMIYFLGMITVEMKIDKQTIFDERFDQVLYQYFSQRRFYKAKQPAYNFYKFNLIIKIIEPQNYV